MAIDITKKEKFIELRAKGLSFQKISKQLGISKPTLIKWNKEEIEKVIEATKNSWYNFAGNAEKKKRERVKRLSAEIEKAYAAISRNDYDSLSTKELIDLIYRYEKQIQKYFDYKSKIDPEDYVIIAVRGKAEDRIEREERRSSEF